MKTTKKFISGDADAEHFKEGSNHIVKLSNIKVVIVPDGPFWYAQGIEIDCAAQGSTIEAAKRNFEKILNLSLLDCIASERTIEALLRPVPAEIFQNVVMGVTEENMQWERYSQSLQIPEKPTSRLISNARSELSAININYLVAKAAQVHACHGHA